MITAEMTDFAARYVSKTHWRRAQRMLSHFGRLFGWREVIRYESNAVLSVDVDLM